MPEVNDMQSRLNRTRVSSIVEVPDLEQIACAIDAARAKGQSISICGGQHAMGQQQFGTDSLMLDIRGFNQVTQFDAEKGTIEVQSGMMWPELIQYLTQQQMDEAAPWSIRQKQTGVDEVTLGGSLAANIHGRGLKFPPLIDDIESFRLIDAQGNHLLCSREENRELFSLAIGGYGLFGVVTHVTLRLVRRQKLKRMVEVIAVKNLVPRVDDMIAEGFLYGDCQYSISLQGDEEFHPGVFSCYRPVDIDTPMRSNQRQLTEEDWQNLYALARTDKQKVFQIYSQYYLETSGQVYWSDTHQLSNVFQGYKSVVDTSLGTEMITEVYVRRENLVPFLQATRRDFVQNQSDVTYGTIRFIEPDSESFLAWAKEPFVCIVCNLHVHHSEAGIQKAMNEFRGIIDRAIEFGGTFYLTYHKWATREQIEACYPQFEEFLRYKKQYDPEERFQSDWYRYGVGLFT